MKLTPQSQRKINNDGCSSENDIIGSNLDGNSTLQLDTQESDISISDDNFTTGIETQRLLDEMCYIDEKLPSGFNTIDRDPLNGIGKTSSEKLNCKLCKALENNKRRYMLTATTEWKISLIIYVIFLNRQ